MQQQQDRREEKGRDREERHRKERECKEWKKLADIHKKEISQKEKEGAWNISSRFISFHEEK